MIYPDIVQKEAEKLKSINDYNNDYLIGYYDGFMHAQKLPYYFIECDNCSGTKAIEKPFYGNPLISFSNCNCQRTLTELETNFSIKKDYLKDLEVKLRMFSEKLPCTTYRGVQEATLLHIEFLIQQTPMYNGDFINRDFEKLNAQKIFLTRRIKRKTIK